LVLEMIVLLLFLNVQCFMTSVYRQSSPLAGADNVISVSLTADADLAKDSSITIAGLTGSQVRPTELTGLPSPTRPKPQSDVSEHLRDLIVQSASQGIGFSLAGMDASILTDVLGAAGTGGWTQACTLSNGQSDGLCLCSAAFDAGVLTHASVLWTVCWVDCHAAQCTRRIGRQHAPSIHIFAAESRRGAGLSDHFRCRQRPSRASFRFFIHPLRPDPVHESVQIYRCSAWS